MPRPEALAHLRSPGVDVRHAADAADAEIRHFETRVVLLVARRVVQSAPQRPRTVTRHGIVEADAVQVDVRELRVVTADVETHLAESVRGDVVEQVLRRGERRGQRLRVRRRGIRVELREDRIIEESRVRGTRRNQHNLFEVLDMLRTDADHHIQRLEIRSLELQRIAAGRKIFQREESVAVGDGLHAQRLDLHLDVAQCHAPVARNHRTDDASLLCVGGEGHGREHQNK